MPHYIICIGTKELHLAAPNAERVCKVAKRWIRMFWRKHVDNLRMYHSDSIAYHSDSVVEDVTIWRCLEDRYGFDKVCEFALDQALTVT